MLTLKRHNKRERDVDWEFCRVTMQHSGGAVVVRRRLGDWLMKSVLHNRKIAEMFFFAFSFLLILSSLWMRNWVPMLVISFYLNKFEYVCVLLILFMHNWTCTIVHCRKLIYAARIIKKFSRTINYWIVCVGYVFGFCHSENGGELQKCGYPSAVPRFIYSSRL